jgi:DNA modification methylase
MFILENSLGGPGSLPAYYKTKNGSILLGDSLTYLENQKAESVDIVVTSPPFGLVRKKDYGNVESHEYVEWFRPFAAQIARDELNHYQRPLIVIAACPN